MEVTTIFGLPAHPLVVHAPVVLVPLTAIGAIVIALSAKWRARIGWIVVALGAVAVAASWFASQTGEALEEALNEENDLLERHASLGDTFIWFALLLFVVVLGLMLWDRSQRRKLAAEGDAADPKVLTRSPVAVVFAVATIAISLVAAGRVYQVGHSGAKAVWQEDAEAIAGSGEGS
jgi:uncharacterized membrane protein